ncbi:MAG: hypothetical protein HYY49_14800 [Ignavibacteriales bacterium]|nr:hypothetical protein [Ignavibacteriales bacterium]
MLSKRTHAVTLDAATSWNNVLTTVTGSIIGTYNGMVDLGLTYGYLTYGNQHKGRAFSPSVIFYPFSAERARLYAALGAAYVTESLFLPSSPGDKLVSANGYSIAIALGALPPVEPRFAALPTLVLVFVNSLDNEEEKSTPLVSGELTFFVPSDAQNVFKITIAAALDDGKIIPGFGFGYLFAWSE